MKKIKDYIDFQLELISESLKNDESVLVLSNKLLNIFMYIESPISTNFFMHNKKWSFNHKVTLIDINDKKDNNGNDILDSVSFSQSNKIYDYIAKNKITELGYDKTKKELTPQQHSYYNHYLINNKESLFSISGRSETSLGKLIKKLFGDEFNNSEIEYFINIYKTLREKPIFEIVEGDDVVYWYNEDKYVSGGGSLNKSCMKESNKSDFIEFYGINKNKVKLLILKDNNDKNKIKGRALIWYLDNPEGRIYMDRIYTAINYLENHFINYAKENKWLYKSEQNIFASTDLIDTKTGNIIKKISVGGIKSHETYPYMDTLKYFDKENGVLLNYNDNETLLYKLESTVGLFEILNDNIYWSDYYGVELNTLTDNVSYCEFIGDYRYDDDCYYSEHYSTNIDYEYRDKHMIECDYYTDKHDRWRLLGDVIKTYDGKYVTEEWGRANFIKFSIYFNAIILDAVWSDYYGSYISSVKDKVVIEVLEYISPKKYDWRFKDDGTYYEYNGKYIDYRIKKENIIK